MSIVVFSRYEKSEKTAGPKAKTDIEKILKKDFSAKVVTIAELPNNRMVNFANKIVVRIIPKMVCKRNDTIVVQWPFSNNVNFIKKARKSIVIIHDLDGLRHLREDLITREVRILDCFDYIICHNRSMKNYLIEKDIKECKIKVLNVFDYLCEATKDQAKISGFSRTPKVVYAGNLVKKKCPFVYSLKEKEMNFELNLFGVNFKPNENRKLNYFGSFSPEELPDELKGDVGLIWDGEVDERDENESYKNYTKYNNPHKLSCYLAAGLPVIVWRKSAIADFVKRNNVGYIISSVKDINKLDYSDYEEKKKNVLVLMDKVRGGFYTKKVMNEILEEKQGE